MGDQAAEPENRKEDQETGRQAHPAVGSSNSGQTGDKNKFPATKPVRRQAGPDAGQGAEHRAARKKEAHLGETDFQIRDEGREEWAKDADIPVLRSVACSQKSQYMSTFQRMLPGACWRILE